MVDLFLTKARTLNWSPQMHVRPVVFMTIEELETIAEYLHVREFTLAEFLDAKLTDDHLSNSQLISISIGIDFGSVRLVQVGGGLTVVGEPVVYACRLSGGPAKTTLVNQPAFEQIIAQCGAMCFANEQTHEIKHEGSVLAYDVRLNGRAYSPALPDWASNLPSASAPTTKPSSSEKTE